MRGFRSRRSRPDASGTRTLIHQEKTMSKIKFIEAGGGEDVGEAREGQAVMQAGVGRGCWAVESEFGRGGGERPPRPPVSRLQAVLDAWPGIAPPPRGWLPAL